MSEWTPEDGGKVMVGEHGPYVARVPVLAGPGWDLEETSRRGWVSKNVPTAWLSPAPEPEPDEPSAPGALVRDGEGDLASLGDDLTDERAWVVLTGDLCGEVVRWSDLPRPITVILADPAEVETLRAERDELQRRRDDTLHYLKSRSALAVPKHAASILRGDAQS